MTLEVGQAAPPFTLPGAGGVQHSLAAHAGRTLVLYFYPKDDTSGCTREAQEFDALRERFAEVGADVLGVSPDGPTSHAKFSGKYGLGLSLASDESRETLQLYGVWAEKSMYGRRYMGVERTTFLIGPDGRIRRIWSKVGVPGHAAEVLEAAKAL